MTDYLIRTLDVDGSIAGTHVGNVERVNVPDGETGETFNNRDDFDARLAELTPADTSPDVDGLLLAAHAPTDQGGIGKQAARALARDYPDLTTALTRRNWSVARAAVDDAHTDGALTDSQHQTVVDLMAAYHIPEA